jgi:hypothetical protein
MPVRVTTTAWAWYKADANARHACRTTVNPELSRSAAFRIYEVVSGRRSSAPSRRDEPVYHV